MKYKIIFTTGYDNEFESISRGVKADVLVLDENGDYYCPQFITLERLYNEAISSAPCYLEENLVIVQEITRASILACVGQLHSWLFQKRWRPITQDELLKYFYPTDVWYIEEMEL